MSRPCSCQCLAHSLLLSKGRQFIGSLHLCVILTLCNPCKRKRMGARVFLILTSPLFIEATGTLKRKKKKDGKVMYLIFVLFIAKLIFRQPVVWCYVRTGPRPRLGKTESRSKREAPGPRRSRARPTGGELALSLVCFQADVLCEAARDPALRLSEQCPHDHAALQPGQGAGEILQDVV